MGWVLVSVSEVVLRGEGSPKIGRLMPKGIQQQNATSAHYENESEAWLGGRRDTQTSKWIKK